MTVGVDAERDRLKALLLLLGKSVAEFSGAEDVFEFIPGRLDSREGQVVHAAEARRKGALDGQVAPQDWNRGLVLPFLIALQPVLIGLGFVLAGHIPPVAVAGQEERRFAAKGDHLKPLTPARRVARRIELIHQFVQGDFEVVGLRYAACALAGPSEPDDRGACVERGDDIDGARAFAECHALRFEPVCPLRIIGVRMKDDVLFEDQ